MDHGLRLNKFWVLGALDHPVARAEHRARRLHVVLWFSMALGLLSGAANALLGRSPAFSLLPLSFFFACLLLRLWVAQHPPRRAEIGLVVCLYGFVTLGLVLRGTVYVPLVGFYALPVALSGVFFGHRFALIGSAIALGLIGALMSAEAHEMLPGYFTTDPVTQWFIAAILIGCSAGLSAALHRLELASLRARSRAQSAPSPAGDPASPGQLATGESLPAWLPVCAWCRQVRDEEGDYVPLEKYVETRLNTTISHGICPGCRAGVLEKHRVTRIGAKKSPPSANT
jgi:hypothetical protein